MSRERYNVEIKCPNCGQTGILRVSENDYPFMRKLDRDVSVTQGEFESKMINENDAEISCKVCQTIFKW